MLEGSSSTSLVTLTAGEDEVLCVVPVTLDKGLTFARVLDEMRAALDDELRADGRAGPLTISARRFDNFVGGSRPVDTAAHFLWGDPEIEEVALSVEGASSEARACFSIQCDFSHYYSDECEIIDACAPLYGADRRDQLDIYWRVREQCDAPAFTRIARGVWAATVARLTGGFAYVRAPSWDLVVAPAHAEDFLRAYLRWPAPAPPSAP